MRAISHLTLGVGTSIFLTSSLLLAQQPAPRPAAPPAPPAAAPAQPYPGQPPAQPYPGQPPAPYPGQPSTAPPPYGAPPNYAPPPPGYGYAPPPARLAYREGEARPGYHLEESPRKGLVISGAITFAVPYLLSVTAAISSTYSPDKWLLVPVIGPLATIAARSNSCDVNSLCDSIEPVIRFYLALDFVAQATGVTLFALGFIFPKKELVNDQYPAANAFKLKSWAVAPRIFDGTKPGLVLSGEMF
jgi:hypothetical protein